MADRDRRHRQARHVVPVQHHARRQGAGLHVHAAASPASGSRGSTSTSSTAPRRATKFDAGLINIDKTKRPGYAVVKTRKARELPQVIARPSRADRRTRAAPDRGPLRVAGSPRRPPRLRERCPPSAVTTASPRTARSAPRRSGRGPGRRAARRGRPSRRPAKAAVLDAAKRRSPRAGDLVVRRQARAADDGYDHELVPGLRATRGRDPPRRRARLLRRPPAGARDRRHPACTPRRPRARPRGGRCGWRS